MLRKYFIASVIVIVLGLQCLATFGPLAGLYAYRHYWPWIIYPMYSKKRMEGQYIDVAGVIYVENEDGSKIEVTEDMLNLGGFWRPFRLYQRLSSGDVPSTDDIQTVINSVSSERKIVAIETYYYPLVITKEGAMPVDLELRRRIEVE